MTRARRELVDLDTTPYYHCICRCVRRAFLCGEDSFTGKSYEHRKGWVLERLRTLQGVFAIDLCAYAVMSNHYHLVVRLNRERAHGWSEEEVMTRWERLFSLPLLVARYRSGETVSTAEGETAREIIARWRDQIYTAGLVGAASVRFRWGAVGGPAIGRIMRTVVPVPRWLSTTMSPP